MQIVRDLAGYTMGEADNIRRAMSKKKQYVIDENREYFVNGNAEKKIDGCVAKGIDGNVANGIYDSMVNFAKYAFNKSHAACYAVVAYQTAWLKYYYPVEFMAALMTSVIDNSAKVSEYILVCRSMGIKLLPPDVNEGEAVFSVSGDSIRYGLSAIKSVGRTVIDAIVNERETNGQFTDLNDFIKRNMDVLNKRSIENFIKGGACDRLGGNRRQYMSVYNAIVDKISDEKKKGIEGQMSLFDFASDDSKGDFDIQLPDLKEYDKETLLGFEKEILGIYVSGHPLEEYEQMWKKNITKMSTDFVFQEEDQSIKVVDGESVTIGGIITDKSVVYTKKGEAMARFNLEDLAGSVKIIAFPATYKRNTEVIKDDRKVFIRGRVHAEDQKDGELFVETITPFEEVARKLWIKFDNREAFEAAEKELMSLLVNRGRDEVVIFLAETKQMKKLQGNMCVDANDDLIEILENKFGKDNVKLV